MEACRPRVVISAACTIDGKISSRTGDSAISSPEDAARLHGLRAEMDAILIGKGTLERDDPLLTVRYCTGRNPVRVVLDPAGEIPSNSNILRTCGQVPTILVVTGRMTRHNGRRLEGFPVEIIRTQNPKISVEWLLRNLWARGIRTVMVEGGGATNWEFVKSGMVDEVVLTVSPYVVGGDGATLVDGEGFPRISDSPGMSLKRVLRQGDEVVLHYVRVWPEDSVYRG